MFSQQLRVLDRRLRLAATGEELGLLLDKAKNDAFLELRLAGHSQVAAQCLALKMINACLGRVEFQARRTRVVARPFGLELDPCNGCGLACPGCVHSQGSRRGKLFDWPNGMLAPNRMQAFLRRYGPWAVQAVFCNYGEPLLNPRTPDNCFLACVLARRRQADTIC